MADMDALRGVQANWELVDETGVPAPGPAPSAERAFARLKDRRLAVALAVAGALTVAAGTAPAWVR